MATPSIAMIPSGYKDGKIYSVLPNSVDGDFTFSRGSAATRVNEQGLVENVQIISSELVLNGNFSQGIQDWTLGAGWSIGDGKATSDGSGYSSIIQSISNLINKKIKVQFDIVDYTSGTIRILPNDRQDGADVRFSGNGTYTQIYTSINNKIDFQPQLFNGSITNISLKEITDDTDLPRLDYTDGSCPSLLLEPQSTNLVTYSEDFSQSYWNLAGGDKTSGQLSPNGDNSAYRIDFDGSNIGNFLRSVDITLTADTTYTASWYIKNINLNDTTRFQIESISGGGTGAVNIDTLQDYGTIPTDKFTRYSITFTTGDASGQYRIRVMQAGSSNNTNSFIIANAQLEQSYATSYIPTNGAIATRLADVATNSGNASLINSTEGVLYFEGSALTNETDVNKTIGISDVSSSNRVQFALHGTPSRISFYGTSSEGFALSYSNFSYNKTEPLKIALKWKIGDVGIFINGLKVYTDTPANTFLSNTLNTLSFTDFNNTSSPFYGKVKALAVYKEALTDAELQSLTTI